MIRPLISTSYESMVEMGSEDGYRILSGFHACMQVCDPRVDL
jgi:hypothetical protein